MALWFAYDIEEQILMSAVQVVVAAILKVASSLFVAKAVMAAAGPSQADLPRQALQKGSSLVSVHHAPGFPFRALVDVAPLLQAQARVLRSFLLLLAQVLALLSSPLSIS